MIRGHLIGPHKRRRLSSASGADGPELTTNRRLTGTKEDLVTEDSTWANGEDHPTQSWLTGALAGTCRLTADDVTAISDLRSGTAMLLGVGGPFAGSRMLLWRAEVKVGRGQDCLVWLPPRTVSRHHATLIRRDEAYELVDAGSLNGSFVNRHRVDRALLRHGDEVQFGSCRFLYFEGAYEQ